MSSIPAQLALAQLQLFRYEIPIIFAIGIIGNLINIGTFARKELRKNMCSWYFICLSVAHISVLCFACLPRIISASTGYDLSSQSLAFCKFRGYITDVSLTLGRHFLCLIAIDRWLVTSAHLWIRNHSSPKITQRVIIISVLFWIICNIHSMIKFDIGRLGCSPPLGTTYELFYSMYNVAASVVPMFIMSIFTVLATRNLRLRVGIRIQPHPLTNSSRTNPPGISNTNTSNQLRQSRRERQLIRLSILQVTVFLILNAIRAFFPLYSFLLNSRGNLTPDEVNVAVFINGIGNNLLFTYTAVCLVLFFLREDNSIELLSSFIFRSQLYYTH